MTTETRITTEHDLSPKKNLIQFGIGFDNWDGKEHRAILKNEIVPMLIEQGIIASPKTRYSNRFNGFLTDSVGFGCKAIIVERS